MARPVTIAGVTLAVVAGAAVAAVVTLVIGVRTRNRTIMRAMHRMQRDLINRRALASAGQPGAPYAVIRHTGRRSGRTYETPVGAVGTPEGVAITLPYGTETDWVRNVLAAGRAVIVLDGEELALVDPAVVPLADTTLADVKDPMAALFGVNTALVLRLESAPTDPGVASGR